MADERPQREQRNTAEETAKAWRKSQPIFDAVWQLVGGVGLGVGGGYFLDGRLHTTPWCMVAGSVLGMTVGFIGFFRSITKASKRH
jgi:F0F1-type ATP synthase assembly protein I